MNGTPRLRSAYPASPKKVHQKDRAAGEARATRPDAAHVPVDDGSRAVDGASLRGPLISLTLLDAPTQRFYVAAFYVVLWAWRLVNYSLLVSNGMDSPWQWMKWTAIDGMFLYAVPELRIPWLEWSSTTIILVFLVHALLNGILMFRIPVRLFHHPFDSPANFPRFHWKPG